MVLEGPEVEMQELYDNGPAVPYTNWAFHGLFLLVCCLLMYYVSFYEIYCKYLRAIENIQEKTN